MSRKYKIYDRRFGQSRPGFKLLAIEEAAIPVSVMRADVLAQEAKPLPPTEEFVLRFAALGVDTVGAISGYLGLEETHVVDAVAGHISNGRLRRRHDGSLEVTLFGLGVVSTLVASQPVLRQLPVYFDRLTWKAALYAERDLIEKREANERGLTIIPAARNAHIGLDDVSSADLNAFLRGDRLQVLRLHKLVARKHRYFEVDLLVFGDAVRRELQLAICIEDELVPAHGVGLDRIEAVQKLDMRFTESLARPILSDSLERMRGEAERLHGDPLEGVSGERGGASAGVVPIEGLPHADVFFSALQTARRRLFLASEGVNRWTVTAEVLRLLEDRLKSGVRVVIVHTEGEQSDLNIIKKLRALSERFSILDVVTLTTSVESVLIFDDTWVSSSFSWLSFQCGRDKVYRVDSGTVVRIPDVVDQQLETLLNLYSVSARD